MLAELANMLLRHDDLARLLRPLPDPEQQALTAMVTRRQQFPSMQLSERQQLQLAMVVMRLGVEAMIAAIRQ